jgi:hypothetical protein
MGKLLLSLRVTQASADAHLAAMRGRFEAPAESA